MDAELQYLKPQLLAQALVHHRFVMDLPDSIWIDEKTGKTAACRVMAVKAYSRTQAKFRYVDFTIISHADRCDLQLPVRRGTVKSVNHAMNLQDLFRQICNHPRTLEDLGITEERSKQIMSAMYNRCLERIPTESFRACMCTLSADKRLCDTLMHDAKKRSNKQQLHARRRKGKLLKMPKRKGPLLVILNK